MKDPFYHGCSHIQFRVMLNLTSTLKPIKVTAKSVRPAQVSRTGFPAAARSGYTADSDSSWARGPDPDDARPPHAQREAAAVDGGPTGPGSGLPGRGPGAPQAVAGAVDGGGGAGAGGMPQDLFAGLTFGS